MLLELFLALSVASGTHLVTPKAVTIPQLTSQGALGVGKPILHKHGLIQVEVPFRRTAVSPAAITAAAPYAVGAPQKGVVVDQTEPTYFCKKEGYTLEGRDTCVKTDLVEARFVCPGGFDFFNGECTRRASFLQLCPEGFQNREGTCAKVVTAASIPTCPENSYEISPGVCERQIVQSLATHCHEGQFDGANCIVHNHVEARAFCPEGFSFFDGACVQEETYDCTHGGLHGTLPTVGHIHTPVHAGGHLHGHPHLRQLTALPSYPRLAAPAVHPCKAGKVGLGLQAVEVQSSGIVQTECAAAAATQEVSKTLVQPTKTTVTMQKTCTRVTSTALVFACDEGILQGQRCLVRTPLAPALICKHQGDSNHCYTTQRVAAMSVCPPDYSRECSGGRCECAALEAAAFVSSCPSGFEEGGEEGCVRTASASIVCPTGYQLQGESCLRVLREPADCVFSVTYECDRTKGQCQ